MAWYLLLSVAQVAQVRCSSNTCMWQRPTLGSSKFLASLQERMTDLLRDAGTISGWTNNSDIMHVCLLCKVLFSPYATCTCVRGNSEDARSEKQQLQHVLQDSHIGNIPTYVQVHSALCWHLQAHSGDWKIQRFMTTSDPEVELPIGDSNASSCLHGWPG